MVNLPSISFPAAHPIQQCVNLPSPMHVTCPVHPNIFGEKYKAWSYSLYRLLQPSSYIQTFPSAPSISTTLSHVVPLIWGTQVHTYTKQDKIIFLYTEFHTFLNGRWEDKRCTESRQYSPQLICLISTWRLLWFHQCLPPTPLTAEHTPPQCLRPLTAEFAPPQCLSPITAEFAPPQCLSPLTAEFAPPQCLPPLTAERKPPQCLLPLTAEHKPPQCLPHLLLNVNHLSVSSDLLLNIHHLSKHVSVAGRHHETEGT